MENSLIFQSSPQVTFLTNKFINVPIIFKYENTNLIEIVKEEKIGFTTQIPIYHEDGTYLAKAKGNRLFLTEDGKKTGLKIEKYDGLWVCELENKIIFEIRQQPANFFKTTAELYTPDGYFVKCHDSPLPSLLDTTGEELKIGGLSMSGNTFEGCRIGIWLKKNGNFLIGVN